MTPIQAAQSFFYIPAQDAAAPDGFFAPVVDQTGFAAALGADHRNAGGLALPPALQSLGKCLELFFAPDEQGRVLQRLR